MPENKTRTILITGGAGFIGSNLAAISGKKFAFSIISRAQVLPTTWNGCGGLLRTTSWNL
jgi:hypothetical protein